MKIKRIAILSSLMMLLACPAWAQAIRNGQPVVKKSWSLSVSVGQSLDNAGPLTSQFLRSDQFGGSYYLNRQVFAKSQSFLSYSRHYQINNWLSANWNATWSDYEVELHTNNVYINNTSEGPPPGAVGFLLSTIRGTTITSLGLSPGVKSRVPIGKKLWLIGGVQSGAMFHKGSIFVLGNKEPTASIDRSGVRWQNLVEAGMEFQPLPKSQGIHLFGTYQFVHLSKGSGQSEWTQFQNFGQVQFGIRIAAKPHKQ